MWRNGLRERDTYLKSDEDNLYLHRFLKYRFLILFFVFYNRMYIFEHWFEYSVKNIFNKQHNYGLQFSILVCAGSVVAGAVLCPLFLQANET